MIIRQFINPKRTKNKTLLERRSVYTSFMQTSRFGRSNTCNLYNDESGGNWSDRIQKKQNYWQRRACNLYSRHTNGTHWDTIVWTCADLYLVFWALFRRLSSFFFCERYIRCVFFNFVRYVFIIFFAKLVTFCLSKFFPISPLHLRFHND